MGKSINITLYWKGKGIYEDTAQYNEEFAYKEQIKR